MLRFQVNYDEIRATANQKIGNLRGRRAHIRVDGEVAQKLTHGTKHCGVVGYEQTLKGHVWCHISLTAQSGEHDRWKFGIARLPLLAPCIVWLMI